MFTWACHCATLSGMRRLSSSSLLFLGAVYIIPISLIQVSPKVGGMVMKLYITEGMRVDKDKPFNKLPTGKN